MSCPFHGKARHSEESPLANSEDQDRPSTVLRAFEIGLGIFVYLSIIFAEHGPTKLKNISLWLAVLFSLAVLIFLLRPRRIIWIGILVGTALVLVISAWSRSGYIEHQTLEFSSILRFIEDRFDLDRLTERDEKSNDLFDAFDFEGHARPPLILFDRTCPGSPASADFQLDPRYHGGEL